MSPRVTRSAARLAADLSPTATNTLSSVPSASPPSPLPPAAAASARPSTTATKKRKAVQPESIASEDTTTPSSTTRKSKRTKLSEVALPPQTATTKPGKRSSVQSHVAAMSSTSPDGDGHRHSQRQLDQSPDEDTPEHHQPTTARRRSSRKKSASGISGSSSSAVKRSKKATPKTHLETPLTESTADWRNDADEDELFSVNKSVPKTLPSDPSDGSKDPLVPHKHLPTTDHDDPFAGGLLNRPGMPSGLSNTLRALSGMMSGMSGRFKGILENLRAKDDPSIQMIALSELSEVLLVSNEDNLAGYFSPAQYVKELVTLMQPNEIDEQNQEMMLLACRCIANLIEALPSATAAVVYGGAVPILCQKLLEISYIDLAEQALVTLEKISVEFPASIVRNGGLTACLSYLDFFATSTQRTAVTTAANCCRNIPEESFSVVRDVMPILLNVLASSDQRVVEQGSLCVCRIAESFKWQDSKLEELISPDLLRTILGLLLPGTTNLIGANIHTQFIRLLATVARASSRLSSELLKMNVVDALYQILTSVSAPPDLEDFASKIDKTVIMQALIRTPKDHIFETLDVICELLPPADLDDSVILDETERSELATFHSANPASVRSRSSHKRVKVLQSCKPEMERFATILFPTLMHTYTSTVNLNVRQKALTAQLRMLSNLDVDVVADALRNVAYSSHLAAILSQQDDPTLLRLALQAAELLLKRLPDVYRHRFYREGIIAETHQLAQRPVKIAHRSQSEPAAPAKKGQPGQGNNALGGLDNATEEVPENVSETIAPPEDEDMDDDDDAHSDSGDSDAMTINKTGTQDSTSDDFITRAAQRFVANYGQSEESSIAQDTKRILEDLQGIATSLERCYNSDDFSTGPSLFRRLASHFSSNALTGITSYELLISGVVECLLDILSDDRPSASAEARKAFASAFMSRDDSIVASPSRFAVMINKLQDLLSRTEHFEVLTVYHNAAENSRSSAASVLAKQMRLRLTADKDSGIPSSYRNIMVSIHAIATFRALDEYLRPRLSASMAVPVTQQHNGPAPSALGSPSGQSPSDAMNLKHDNEDKKMQQDQCSTETDKPPTNLRRSSRRLSGREPVDGAAPSEPNPSRDSDAHLECADQVRASDEDDEDDDEDDEDTSTGDVDAVMEDLEDDIGSDEEDDEPSAVNLEIAKSGQITAKKEDGTRVSTPQQNHQYLAFSRLSSASARLAAAREYLSRPSAMQKAMSYASALQAVPDNWHIEFSVNGHPVSNDTTIYRAVHVNQRGSDSTSSRHMWSALHTISFKRVPGPALISPDLTLTPPQSPAPATEGVPQSLADHPKTAAILRLMGILHSINNHLEDIIPDGTEVSELIVEPLTRFVNSKLTAKLNRQLEEPLIVASNCLPSWSEDLARQYHFVFPFETRHVFLQATSFGYSRSMSKWQGGDSSNESRRHRETRAALGRTQRQKVRISRTRILESALKVMEMYGSSPSILEVEYFEEVGTGLGPTLEFYSSVSKEFSRKKLHLWRENESDEQSEFAFGRRGLFPGPLSAAEAEDDNGKRVLHLFKLLGKFVARSMLDSRMIDVAFNPTFFRVASGHIGSNPSLGALSSVDQSLAASLKDLVQAAERKQQIDQANDMSASAKADAYRQITVRGVSIENLALDFTLPGHASISLIEGGSEIAVSLDNVGLYVQKVIEWTLVTGVQRQMEAFRTGFSQVFPYTALQAFTSIELAMLFGSGEEDWALETLMDSIKADHGFNLDSSTVRNLLQVMSQYTEGERRDFLQFVTGSPKLPIGGFKSLTPMFTVVCKPSEPPLTANDYLPSVMTCVNYLKMPDYSSLEVVRARLAVAIKEGQGAFHLS